MNRENLSYFIPLCVYSQALGFNANEKQRKCKDNSITRLNENRPLKRFDAERF